VGHPVLLWCISPVVSYIPLKVMFISLVFLFVHFCRYYRLEVCISYLLGVVWEPV